MSRNRIIVLTITLMLMVACIIPTPADNQGTTPTGTAVTGSGGFSVQTASANSVLLTWPATAGAQKYLLDVQTGEGEFLQVAELNADQTSYEDIGVPESFQLTYRLRAQTSSGTSAGDTVTVTTPEATPAPLTVQANDYAPIAWTPPTPDPNNLNVDPSTYYPPGFDPAHPENFDSSSMMQPVRASADIGPEGGTLNITTPDNITYALTVPPDALEEITPISLIPIKTIDGLPFDGGLQGAVRIEPDGLMLDLPATLTISRADTAPLPDGMIPLAFGFDGSGQEFHLQPFDTTNQTGLHPGAGHMARQAAGPGRAGPLADIAIQQLKGYGIEPATVKQAAAVIKTHTPTAAEDRLLNELAYGQATEPELSPLVSRQRLAVSKLLSQAQTEAPDWGQMTVTLGQLEILMKYYGKDPSVKADLAKALDLLVDRLSKMLKYNLEKCLTGDDFYVQAVAGKILGAKPGSVYDALKKKLDPQLLKDVAEMHKKCILALTIQSQITVDQPTVAKYVLHVEGRIDPLKFNFRGGKVFLTGTGMLNYSQVEIIPYPIGKDHCDPWIPDNVDSVLGRVNVTRLDLTFAAVPNGVLQAVTLPGMMVTDSGTFSGTETCHFVHDDGTIEVASGKVSIPAPGGSAWYGNFVAAHVPDLTLQLDVHPSDNRPLNNSGQPIIADVNYNRPSFSPGAGTWSEDSTFTLIDNSPK